MNGSPSSPRRIRLRVLPVVLAALVLGPAAAAQAPPPGASLRLHGLVEAVQFFNLIAPSGAQGRLTIVRLAAKGTTVRKGDIVVEFDRQQPLREAIDKEAEWKQLEEDIRRKEAEMRLQAATDDTALKIAENDLALARLETTKNGMLSRIAAEKNTVNVQAAEAKLPSLRTSVALKRKAADAELEILRVKRDRAARVRDRAQATADALLVRTPIDGLVVPRPTWKNGTMADVEEGDEVWPGFGLLDIVGPGPMRVRVKVNQVDLHRLQVGMPARVTLDAYPSKTYPARLAQVSPIATSGFYSQKVRTFAALFAIEAEAAELAPDLSAAVDLVLAEGARAAR